MGRPRIMLDVGFFERRKVAELAWRRQLGFIYVLTRAKLQDREGVFASKAVLKVAAGVFRADVDDLMAGGLIHDSSALCDKCVKAFPDLEKDAVVVHDWHEYQVSRTTSWRMDRDADETSVKQPGNNGETVVKPLSRAPVARFHVPSSKEETTEGVQGEPNAWDAFLARTGEVPGPKFRTWLDELSEAHSEARVVSMLGRIPKTQSNPTDYLKAVRDALRAEDMAEERAERDREKAAVAKKRAPLPRMTTANDISEAEAKRQAAEYLASTKGAA